MPDVSESMGLQGALVAELDAFARAFWIDGCRLALRTRRPENTIAMFVFHSDKPLYERIEKVYSGKPAENGAVDAQRAIDLRAEIVGWIFTDAHPGALVFVVSLPQVGVMGRWIAPLNGTVLGPEYPVGEEFEPLPET